MGHSHAATGMIAGLATLPAVQLHRPVDQLCYVGLWAGAAVIPDWDHQAASPSIMWGPVSGLLSEPLRHLPGGHRWATHDLVLAPAVGAAITWLLANATGVLVVLGVDAATALQAPGWVARLVPFLIGVVPLAMLIGLALKMTVLPRGSAALPNLIYSVALAWWFTHHPAVHLAVLLPVIVAGGIVVHILGDALTQELIPVPIVWLFNRTRFGLPLFEVNGRFERWIVTPALGLLVCWLTWRQLPPVIQHDIGQVLRQLTRRPPHP